MAKKYKFDFSTQLHHLRRGRPFCGQSLALPQGLFDDESDWKAPLKVGTVLELVLLYGQRIDQSEKDKRAFFAAAMKARDCEVLEVTEENLTAMRKGIGVLAVEPLGLLSGFLDDPSAVVEG